MTAPRQILPGKTHFVTRRCSERRFFLRPSELTNAIFLYVLAVAAKRFEVEVHASCVLSNQFHLVVTDLAAQLPAFMQYLDGLVARATNSTVGHSRIPTERSDLRTDGPRRGRGSTTRQGSGGGCRSTRARWSSTGVTDRRSTS